MRRLTCVPALFVLAGCFAWGQALPPVSAEDGPGTVPLAAHEPIMLRDGSYRPGNGVTAPLLVKAGSGHYSQEALNAGYEVTSLVAATIGPDGVPGRVRAFADFEKGLRTEAEDVVLQSKFEPGKLQGKPVAVQFLVAVSFGIVEGKPEVRVYQPGDDEFTELQQAHRAYLQVHSPFGRPGGGPLAQNTNRTYPVPIHSAAAEPTDAARKARYGGVVELSVLITEDGVPTDIRVEKGLEMGLNEKAIEAAQQYQFRPATENGKPVAMRIKMDVSFAYR